MQARTLRLLGTCLVTVAALAILSGCAREPVLSPDQQAVRATITRYNELLTEGYRALNMNRMREVADELQSEDEYIFMSSLAEGGIRLDPELKDLEFEKVSVETTSAQVETRETWDYRHYSRANGKLVQEQSGLVYSLAWDLSKQPDGRWLVTDVRATGASATAEPRVLDTITPVPSENP